MRGQQCSSFGSKDRSPAPTCCHDDAAGSSLLDGERDHVPATSGVTGSSHALTKAFLVTAWFALIASARRSARGCGSPPLSSRPPVRDPAAQLHRQDG